MQRWNCLVVALVFLSVVVGGQQVVPVFASPSGTPVNAGSLASPFDLVTAFNASQGHLSQNSSVSLFIASGILSPLHITCFSLPVSFPNPNNMAPQVSIRSIKACRCGSLQMP